MAQLKLDKKLCKRLTREQLAVLKESVRKRREIPVRVVYTQEYWDDIAKDSSYALASRELAALKKSIPHVAKALAGRKVNVVHMGVGNGIEVPILVKAIKERNIGTYSIVDVNRTMLDISEKKVRKQFPSLRVLRFNRDMETYGVREVFARTRKAGAKSSLAVLIANGVLFSNDGFVKGIGKSMGKDDFFLLSLELYKPGKDQEIIDPYLIPTVLDLLANGVRLLGYESRHEYYDGEVDKKDQLLKIYFNPGGDKSRRLLALKSYKPTVAQLNKRMAKLGFRTLLLREFKAIHTCVALYRKKPEKKY